MFDFLKRMLAGKSAPQSFTPGELARWDEVKQRALELVLGPMDEAASQADTSTSTTTRARCPEPRA